ncbi:NAD(P)-binding protein, partial [Zopfia rhizophila CBS 207.26]
MAAAKAIVVVGITGNQGGSVAEAFLQIPGWRVIRITGNVNSEAALRWASRGVEMRLADLSQLSSLQTAFAKASVIFGMTDFWQHMRDRSAQKFSHLTGQSLAQICYSREVQQGQNLVDAAASVSGLELFVLSTLSGATKWSYGRITGAYNFDAKRSAVEYLQQRYPELWNLTSLVQAASFMENYKKVTRPQADGTFVIGTSMPAHTRSPWIHPTADMGTFVKALVQIPPGQNLAGQAEELSWDDICTAFTRVSGIHILYRRYTASELERLIPNGGYMLAAMFDYFRDVGYYGGDSTIVYPKDLEQRYSVTIPTTTYEAYFRTDLPSFFEQVS